ncbi:D-alanyl-D-alanine carboxypeptidase family protein [Actinomadura roseirufa]|uniref:D-alanyl-D-alanine carboxypeptidase family protein n=1 Tax=Actinomadura roseirufa TaxID=2094049 RepID=UPI001F5E7136|nr:hypothetical protein [Actinomadura roseirufa]
MDDAQREPEHADRTEPPRDEPASGVTDAPDTAEETTGDSAVDATGVIAEDEPSRAPEPEPVRTATAEFRVPGPTEPDAAPAATRGGPDEPSAARAAALTRPDISVRPSATPTVRDIPLPAKAEPEPGGEDESAGGAAEDAEPDAESRAVEEQATEEQAVAEQAAEARPAEEAAEVPPVSAAPERPAGAAGRWEATPLAPSAPAAEYEDEDATEPGAQVEPPPDEPADAEGVPSPAEAGQAPPEPAEPQESEPEHTAPDLDQWEQMLAESRAPGPEQASASAGAWTAEPVQERDVPAEQASPEHDLPAPTGSWESEPEPAPRREGPWEAALPQAPPEQVAPHPEPPVQAGPWEAALPQAPPQQTPREQVAPRHEPQAPAGPWEAALPQAPPQQTRREQVAPRHEPQAPAGPWEAALPEAPPQQTPPEQAAPRHEPQAPAGPWEAALPQALAPGRSAPPQGEQRAPAGPWEAAAPHADEWAGTEAPGHPGTRSSGQWTVPWEGQAGAPPARPATPAPPRAGAGAHRPRGKRRRGLISVLVVLVLVVGAVVAQFVRPVPDPAVKLTIGTSAHKFPGAAPTLPWPAQGQSVVTVDGLGTMGASGGSAPTPTASVAKVMTAYVYLRDHPLRAGEPGPVLTVSPQAAAQIPARRKRGESLLGVTAGQRLPQRKFLEALMIISANDVAHELARWDVGNEPAFVAKMNATARSLGMTNTTYTDPSGYDSGTVSTAADQVKLLRAAMDVPAFAEIVNNRAYVPEGGGAARPGGNILLGQYGVVGGKTGYTDAAGGNFVFAARKRVAGVPTLIVGAVMGQRSTSAMAAVTAGGQLVAAAESSLTAVTLARAGARVGRVDDGLGGGAPLRAASNVTVVGWPGLTVPVGVEGDPPRTGGRGDRAGAVTTGAGKVPLELDGTLGGPSPLKRLTRLG